MIASIGLTTGLHPDFGSGTYRGAIIGIPYVVVSSAQPLVAIKLRADRKQSDPGPYPVPPDAPIEGYKPDGDPFKGDRHVLVIDKDSNRLYEMYSSYRQPERQLGRRGRGDLPCRFRRCPPHGEAGLDQRRRCRPAHLSGFGAV